MEANERREELLRLLQLDLKPVSASALAEHFGVSRQIIVGDVALLRAKGIDILATPRGYVLNKDNAETAALVDTYVLACRHDKSGLSQELYIFADHGASLLNITVEHPIYGNITQPLEIKSRYEADAFLNKVALTGASLLCDLADGVHLHTIRCPDSEAYRRILVALKEKGILYVK